MPRSNKTSNVLKLLNLPKVEADAVSEPETVKPEPVILPSANQSENISGGAADGIYSGSTPPPVKRPRKAIVKYMKFEKLSESAAENPALKAIPVEDRVYVRPSGERQIISVPLMLINEQIGTAVERFNACACDECLRVITDRALDLMPPMYIRVINSMDEDEVNRLIKERRQEAIRVLAKICITAHSKPFHDFTDERFPPT